MYMNSVFGGVKVDVHTQSFKFQHKFLRIKIRIISIYIYITQNFKLKFVKSKSFEKKNEIKIKIINRIQFDRIHKTELIHK